MATSRVARTELGIGQRSVRVLPALHADQVPVDSLANQIHRDIAKRGRHHLVEGIRLAAAQIVGQIADHGLIAGAALDLLAQRLPDVRLLFVAEGVRLAVFGNGVSPPRRAFRSNQKGIAAGIIVLVLDQQFDHAIEIELDLRNHATASGHVGGVQGGKAGVAAENAKDADALVRAERGALARDRRPWRA